MDASTRFDTQIVGGLPVIANYLDRLQVADIIDRLVPWEGNVPLGTVVEIMIVNRLLAPMPLFRLGEWAEKAGVADYYELQGSQLNDDLLGRGLERIQAHVDTVQTDVVMNAVRGWKVDVSEVHYDITTAELYGAYAGTTPEGETPATPQPAYGRTKSGRKNVKQIQVGVNVTGDGGVPVAHVPLDGNTAEASTHVANMRRLAKLLGRSDLLFIGDTKQDSKETLLEAKAGGGEFLCGGVFSTDMQQYFLRHRRKLRPVAYSTREVADGLGITGPREQGSLTLSRFYPRGGEIASQTCRNLKADTLIFRRPARPYRLSRRYLLTAERDSRGWRVSVNRPGRH